MDIVKKEKRFEMEVDDQIVFIDYILVQDEKYYLTHTEVPKALEGRGLGVKMVSGVIDIIKSENKKIAPLCPFVAKYMSKHQELKDLLAEGFNI